jgi:predicted RNA-binding Zn-ribbon protein involved in translation (DUF1610 family)
MTLGFLEDCPDCGHSGGRPIAVRTESVVGMQCPECESYYDVSVHKESRQSTLQMMEDQ